MITPYQYGIAFEYPGVAEWWVGEFSVHKHPTADAPGRFWVGDEVDSGGVYATASAAQNWAEIASQRFDLSSHGSLNFRVVNNTDAFQWQIGAANSPSTIATLLGTGAFGIGVIPAAPLHVSTAKSVGVAEVLIGQPGDVSTPALYFADISARLWKLNNQVAYDGFAGHNFLVNAVSKATIDNSGDLTVANLAGLGNGYACVDSTGKLYRGATPCN